MVSVRALVCRRCGRRQRVSPRTIYLGLAALTLASMFAVAGLLPLGKGGDPPPYAPAGVPGPSGGVAAPPLRAPERLAAADLWAAYARDPLAADRLYKDKPLVVTGQVIAAPQRDFRGSVVLRLGTGDMLETVHATLAARDITNDATLAKGQTVSVACVGRGALIGAPLLDGCTLQ